MKTVITLSLMVASGLIFTGCGDQASFKTLDTSGDRNRTVPAGTGTDSEEIGTDDSTASGGGGGEKDTNGENPNPSSVSEDPIIDPAEVQKLCQNQQHLSRVETIRFAPPEKTCAWGANGNLTEVQEMVRARGEQYHMLDLGSDSIICDVEFTVPNQQIEFDDEIFLTLNNAVLAASMDYTSVMEKRDNVYFYNWNAIVNQPYLKDGKPHNYCLGADKGLGECVMPYTQTTGDMRLKFDPSIFYNISAYAFSSKYNFGMVTTGDNNDSDCKHTGLEFSVNVKYIKLQQ
ncbi:MAG: hypothetical protein AB7T49_15275 [Oligoflexales bacterium]